jgi:hypothetical protein
LVFQRNGRVHLNWRGGGSVQSTAGSRGVRISSSNDSNAGYTMFRGTVQDYWLPTPLVRFPFTSPIVRHRVPSGFNWALHILFTRRCPAPHHQPHQPNSQYHTSFIFSTVIFPGGILSHLLSLQWETISCWLQGYVFTLAIYRLAFEITRRQLTNMRNTKLVGTVLRAMLQEKFHCLYFIHDKVN